MPSGKRKSKSHPIRRILSPAYPHPGTCHGAATLSTQYPAPPNRMKSISLRDRSTEYLEVEPSLSPLEMAKERSTLPRAFISVLQAFDTVRRGGKATPRPNGYVPVL